MRNVKPMKLHRAIQAAVPAFWSVVFTVGLFIDRDAEGLLFVLPSFVWLACALLLDPRRRWSWWACLCAVAFCALAGIACFGGLIHMACFPTYWAQAEKTSQPGAVLILAGLVFLVPAILLLAHLILIRRNFAEMLPCDLASLPSKIPPR